MANLVVLGHSLKTCVEVVTNGCRKVGLADLSVHLVLELCKSLAGLAVHLKLEIDEKAEILVFFIGIFFHQSGKRLALDELGNDCPLAVDDSDLEDLRDIESRFLDTSLIESLVKDVRLGIILIEDLETAIAVTVNGFVCSDRNNSV